ncbi:helix-turn-helix transcriptional regulator [Pedobacter sp. SL55]|uniref:helix-turn-helix transcriptional regulator n=1 Tax=Pedobacter sp. SL55 TaxID=2995161 RepID=UPI0022713B13|nr:helix-turn-helix transcriptional regulator [Pedobacter sp. SL55]WAC40264.1 helix-turn-helix transcriptional regulator [Pedobacter sp. SL55]
MTDQLSTWQMTYPEKFIAKAVTIPAVVHHENKHQLIANSENLQTTFQYEKVEEGCYLFVVDMTAVSDTKIALFGDRDVEYYCLSYQLIKGDVNKVPMKDNDPMQSRTMSLPRICSFYNNEFDYETLFEKGAGVRAFIFCFTKEWLDKGIDFSAVDQEATFMKVIRKEMEGMAYFSDNFYKDTFDELDQLLTKSQRSPVYPLVVRKLSLTLISDFFSIVADPDSVLNQPPVADEFDGIEKIKAHLDKYFKQGFPGLENLADIGNMTVSTMRRQFLRQMGHSAFDYFRDIQMRYAFVQLQNGTQVKQVAQELSFGSSANFSRIFKKTYKILPAEVKSLKS